MALGHSYRLRWLPLKRSLAYTLKLISWAFYTETCWQCEAATHAGLNMVSHCRVDVKAAPRVSSEERLHTRYSFEWNVTGHSHLPTLTMRRSTALVRSWFKNDFMSSNKHHMLMKTFPLTIKELWAVHRFNTENQNTSVGFSTFTNTDTFITV